MTFDQEAVLRAYATAAEHGHARLTALDQRSGDGDFGDNLRGGLREAVARFDAGSGETAFGALGAVFLDEVGGTSGPLLGLLFTEIGHALAAGDDPVAAFGAGARAGLDAIQRVGEAQVGDRTLVDALAPAVEALPGGFAAGARAAAEGARQTAELRARMGRASYVGDRAMGEPDPGAVGIALLFRAAAEVAEPDAELPTVL
ncbi:MULTISPECIES: DAK2 domain-containing protein [Pseudonocardia]|uniref:PTS-dependent dihydroxyacetone kinase, ADP-binding subunit DhaL n=2 Tax=Pseudonocardia TaxID=1847 RepID=A0A1Y2MLT7_PSEAH|nr:MULTISPECIES: DAK2 domain-containing protein [Pseudonocardia]OSY36243.1 PTS-dependent dihydroxyacetone kinase, ADP-binding subunit DhaL [Pseudonocardia autotrophica]TDN73051.1 dihydroxyacetone kinase DhaL subunit [Pseudonocardia autotrophica]BBG03769.1 dihydroxyacetone kinase subunit L [Pseudonocardia autotrophica]GEC26623.1 dihydroxyacetone kinase subunit L [Pseudonocardia saturnea]